MLRENTRCGHRKRDANAVKLNSFEIVIRLYVELIGD